MTTPSTLLTLAFLLLLALATLIAHAAPAPPEPAPPFGAPTPAEVLKTLRPAHPRLLATASDFDQLKQRVAHDPQLHQWHDKLRARADKMLAEKPSIYELPDGVRLLSISRRVLDRTYTLALLYRLDGDEKYATRLWDELHGAANFPDWHPAHFLDTAEMTHAFAIGYDWLYDKWTPEQRQTLRTAIIDFGLKPALACYRGQTKDGWWVKAQHNWNQVCNGGIGMGALAIADEEPELAGEILANGIKGLPLAMQHYGPDGAWAEGPGYWDYATTYTCTFLAALDTALGRDFGLSQIAGFREAGDFPIYTSGPTGKSFNYADAHDGPIRSPVMFWLARKFERPYYAIYQRDHAAPAALDLLWYDAALAMAPESTGPSLDKYFRGVDVFSFRSAWHDRSALFIAFKAGDNKANHAHLDIGSFVLDALGERFAVLPGPDDYNLPGYFGKQRLTYYRLRAEGHNTLVIDPGEGPDQDPHAAGSVAAYVPAGQALPFATYATLDLTPVYAGHHATSVRRSIAMLKDRRSVVIADEVKADHAVDMWWFMHTAADISVDADGQKATLTLHGKRLVAKLLLPGTGAGAGAGLPGAGTAKFVAMEAVPLPDSPNPAGQNPNKGLRKLAVHVTGTASFRLAVWLVPQDPAAPAAQRPAAADLATLFPEK